jgi:glycosyltransferase involved in cell wall biosynthesis
MTQRVALIQDYLIVRGGAERLLLSLAQVFPGAPIYTSIYRPETTRPEFAEMDVRPLWSSRLPVDRATYRPLVPVYALAFEQLRLEGIDVAFSLAGAFAKSAGRRAGTRVSMCLTPPRFVWPVGVSSTPSGAIEAVGQSIMRPWLRRVDLAAARRVDAFAAISNNVRDRVRRFYGRDASVIYPPVEIEKFPAPAPQAREGYLMVGRLIAYKRFDDVIRLMNKLRKPLTVIGTGPDEMRLRSIAGPTVKFAGYLPDAELARAYASARALIAPGEEDWGLTILEANACGCPVVAAARGGSMESVTDGETGILYDPDDPAGLDNAISAFESQSFPIAKLRAHAERFSAIRFKSEVLGLVEEAVSRKTNPSRNIVAPR